MQRKGVLKYGNYRSGIFIFHENCIHKNSPITNWKQAHNVNVSAESEMFYLYSIRTESFNDIFNTLKCWSYQAWNQNFYQETFHTNGFPIHLYSLFSPDINASSCQPYILRCIIMHIRHKWHISQLISIILSSSSSPTLSWIQQ